MTQNSITSEGMQSPPIAKMVSSNSTRQATAPLAYVPPQPEKYDELGIRLEVIEGLILKLLLYRGTIPGRQIAEQIHLPRPLVAESLETLRAELLIAIKGSSGLEDYIFQLTDAGYDRARRLAKQCSYSGVAPVPLEHYIDAIAQQSLQRSHLCQERLKKAFQDLRINSTLISQLGQAINDGRGLFLYGPPGNGKTSISEKVVQSFGEYVWIPHTITIDGELIRLYDPRSHQAIDLPQLEQVEYDRRWILIHRPTIVVGGELTMPQLDLQHNELTGIGEAPVQLRANCGALVIDDFGRQRMPTSEILNRLIVPMEKQHDYLNLPSGRQVAVPFDMLLVFSTNLEPSDLVDEAFLRRIPYKIEVQGPDEGEFSELFIELAESAQCLCDSRMVSYLLEKHYRPVNRPLRYCHPRDLLRQIRNFCEYYDRPLTVTSETLDIAVRNYFAGL